MANRIVRALTLEHFEPRCVLAALGLDIQLLADVDGAPGQPLSQPEQVLHGPVEIGDFFWIRVAAWDGRDDDPAGVIGLPLNLSWDPAALALLNALPTDGGEVELGDPLLTDQFPLVRFLDDSDAGSLSGLQGASAPVIQIGAAIGVDGPQEFSLLRFQALQAAPTTPFSIELAGSMSFADGQALTEVFHLVDGQPVPSEAETLRVTEFIQIDEVPLVEASSSLSGFVFVDANFDGQFNRQDNGQPLEMGLPNVVIQLFRQTADGPYSLIEQTLSGPDGWYSFNQLEPGVYRVVETQPAGFADGSTRLGDIHFDGGTLEAGDPRRGIAQPNAFSDVELQTGEQAVDYNFAERLTAAQVTKRMYLVSSSSRGNAGDLTETRYVNVRGTDQDDVIQVDVGQDSIAISVNNQLTQQIALTDDRPILVNIDARQGNDLVEFTGGPTNESLWAGPGYAIVQDVLVETTSGVRQTAWRYGVAVDQARQIVASAGGGDDNLAVLQDTPAADTLDVGGVQAILVQGGSAQSPAPSTTVERFQNVRAIASRGGDDLLRQVATLDYVLTAVGRWRRL